jgi:CBS-domain-containing membrane protein
MPRTRIGKKRKTGNETLIKNRIIPAVLTALTVSVLIFVLYYVNFDLSYGTGSSAILFASFGTSAFVMFMMPRSKAATISKFVKSYALATILGIFGFFLLDFLPLYVVAGLVIFLLALLMYMTRSEHPPGVGIAMAFVLYRIDIYGVLIVALAVVILLFLRIALERFVYIVETDVIKEIERL